MLPTILFVDHATAIGGAEKSLLMLLDGLDRSRWSLHLACCPGELSRQVEARGIPLHLVEMPSLRRLPLLAWLRTIYALARGIEADIIYANTARGALYAAPAGLLSGRPFIWHTRDFSFTEADTWMDRPLKRLVSRCASAVVANSAATANQLPNSARVRVIHNGIDLTTLDNTSSAAAARQRLGLPAEAQIVGMLGRLRPWKGQERFIRIASKVLRESPDTYFVVAGGDPFGVNDGYAMKLRCRAEELGIADKLTFTGQLHEVAEVLMAMDLFVHPGDPEPFGLVNLEAMAMAKPVVAFAHGALPEIVEQNVTGVLVPPNDEDACAAAIVEMLRTPTRMEALGAAGRARVEVLFQIDGTVRAVDELLQQQLHTEDRNGPECLANEAP